MAEEEGSEEGDSSENEDGSGDTSEKPERPSTRADGELGTADSEPLACESPSATDRATGGVDLDAILADIQRDAAGREAAEKEFQSASTQLESALEAAVEREKNRSALNCDEMFGLSNLPGTGERATPWVGGDTASAYAGCKLAEDTGIAIEILRSGANQLVETGRNMVSSGASAANLDKYYHCAANCRAWQEGPLSAGAAIAGSTFREVYQFGKAVFDDHSMREAAIDGYQDMKANYRGWERGHEGTRCVDACRPLGPRRWR